MFVTMADLAADPTVDDVNKIVGTATPLVTGILNAFVKPPSQPSAPVAPTVIYQPQPAAPVQSGVSTTTVVAVGIGAVAIVGLGILAAIVLKD